MRKHILSLLILVAGSMLLLTPLTVRGQQQPTQLWNTIWGGTEDEWGRGVAVGSDIYIVGTTESFGAGPYDAFLACYDVDGNQLWNTTWGGTGYDHGCGVAVGSDIYIVGETNSFGVEGFDAFLACYDVDGNQLWNTTWGGTGSEYGNGVAVGSDKIYIVGNTSSFGFEAAFLACYDVDGNQLWNTTWGGIWDAGQGVAVGSNIYVVGDTPSFGAGNWDAFLASFDLDGNQLWNTTWGGTELDDTGLGVAVGSDIYVVGSTPSFGAGDGDAYLVKYGFLPPVAPVRISDIRGRIFEAPENSVYYVSTGNIYDSSALYAFYAYKENPQNLMPSVWSPDSGLYLDVYGRPLFDGHIVALGGRVANRMVRYYEDARMAVVGKGWNGTHHLFISLADGSTLYAVDCSTFNPSERDYFVFQCYRDGDRYVFSEWGFCEQGTYAAGACFMDIIYPDLQDYTEQYYIYSWTDLNDDDIPQSNEFMLLASG